MKCEAKRNGDMGRGTYVMNGWGIYDLDRVSGNFALNG